MDIIYTIWLRNMKRFLRSKSRIVGSIAMPLFFLLFLGVGLNSVVQLPGLGENYIVFLIPGMVAMSVLFTSVFSGIQIIWDKQFGFLKETLVAPVSRLEIMSGQTLGGATTAVIQGSMILVLSMFVGFPLLNPVGFLIALAFMILIGISFTAFGIAIASRMEDMTGFQLIMNFVVFPIFGLSGALFPISSLPAWMIPLTLLDPLTYGVEGIRYGLTGVSQINPLVCGAVIGGFTLVMTILGAYLSGKGGGHGERGMLRDRNSITRPKFNSAADNCEFFSSQGLFYYGIQHNYLHATRKEDRKTPSPPRACRGHDTHPLTSCNRMHRTGT
jgi:ABC-2 type transport system permease protein